MERRHDPSPRPHRGAFPRAESDGSVTLYGIEDWTELSDEPVVLIAWRSDPGDDGERR
jgi:hypothetical protein